MIQMNSECLIYHDNGWACTYTAKASVNPYKDNEGNYRKRTVAILENTFVVGEELYVGCAVDVLIKQGSKVYKGIIDGINKKTMSVRIVLTDGGDSSNYKTILNKIKQWQDKF